MAFVNEYISSGDVEKYNFNALNDRRKIPDGTVPADAWTIDREANVWLRRFHPDPGKTDSKDVLTDVSVWDFFWRTDLMKVQLLTLEFRRDDHNHCSARKKLLEIEMPLSMVIHQAQAIRDLRAALTAYKDGGVHSEAKSFSFVLE